MWCVATFESLETSPAVQGKVAMATGHGRHGMLINLCQISLKMMDFYIGLNNLIIT
jgi:hypothetical protein